MTDELLGDCIRAAVRIARVARSSHLLDPDDVCSIAYCAAWEARLQLLPGAEPEGFVNVVVHRRLVDAVRIRHGRRDRAERPQLVALNPYIDPASIDHEPVGLLIDELAAGDDRTHRLLTALAAGHTKADAAAELGIHPSRVSQILAEVRARAA